MQISSVIGAMPGSGVGGRSGQGFRVAEQLLVVNNRNHAVKTAIKDNQQYNAPVTASDVTCQVLGNGGAEIFNTETLQALLHLQGGDNSKLSLGAKELLNKAFQLGLISGCNTDQGEPVCSEIDYAKQCKALSNIADKFVGNTDGRGIVGLDLGSTRSRQKLNQVEGFINGALSRCNSERLNARLVERVSVPVALANLARYNNLNAVGGVAPNLSELEKLIIATEGKGRAPAMDTLAAQINSSAKLDSKSLESLVRVTIAQVDLIKDQAKGPEPDPTKNSPDAQKFFDAPRGGPYGPNGLPANNNQNYNGGSSFTGGSVTVHPAAAIPSSGMSDKTASKLLATLNNIFNEFSQNAERERNLVRYLVGVTNTGTPNGGNSLGASNGIHSGGIDRTFTTIGTQKNSQADAASETINLGTNAAASSTEAGTNAAASSTEAGTNAAASSTEAGTNAAASSTEAGTNAAASSTEAGTNAAASSTEAGTNAAASSTEAGTNAAASSTEAGTNAAASSTEAGTNAAASSTEAGTNAAASSTSAATEETASDTNAETTSKEPVTTLKYQAPPVRADREAALSPFQQLMKDIRDESAKMKGRRSSTVDDKVAGSEANDDQSGVKTEATGSIPVTERRVATTLVNPDNATKLSPWDEVLNEMKAKADAIKAKYNPELVHTGNADAAPINDVVISNADPRFTITKRPLNLPERANFFALRQAAETIGAMIDYNLRRDVDVENIKKLKMSLAEGKIPTLRHSDKPSLDPLRITRPSDPRTIDHLPADMQDVLEELCRSNSVLDDTWKELSDYMVNKGVQLIAMKLGDPKLRFVQGRDETITAGLLVDTVHGAKIPNIASNTR